MRARPAVSPCWRIWTTPHEAPRSSSRRHAGPAARRSANRTRGNHLGGARLARRRLHPRDHRIRCAPANAATHRRKPAAARSRHHRHRTQSATARVGRQDQGGRSLHQWLARRPVFPQRRAHRVRPEAGCHSASVFAGAGGGLSRPAGARPASPGAARPNGSADCRAPARRALFHCQRRCRYQRGRFRAA